MTYLVAVVALDVVHVDRLRTLLRHVAFLATVTAATTTTTLLDGLLAVTGAVTDLVTVDALLDDLLWLTLLLVALGPDMADLSAVGADGDEAVHREAGLCETLQVLFRRRRPALCELGTPRLRGPLDGDGELLVRDALEVDEGPVDGDLLLLGDQVSVEALGTEGRLKILEGGTANRLGVHEYGLSHWLVKNVKKP